MYTPPNELNIKGGSNKGNEEQKIYNKENK